MAKFGASLSDKQFALARAFVAAGLTSISQAVKAFERRDDKRIEQWKAELREMRTYVANRDEAEELAYAEDAVRFPAPVVVAEALAVEDETDEENGRELSHNEYRNWLQKFELSGRDYAVVWADTPECVTDEAIELAAKWEVSNLQIWDDDQEVRVTPDEKAEFESAYQRGVYDALENIKA